MKNCFKEKTLFLLILLSLTTFIFHKGFAQELSKEEKKALLKEIKALGSDLDKFKAMKDDYYELDEQVTAKHAVIVQKKADLENSNKNLSKKDDAIEYLQEQLRKLKGQVGEVNATKQGRGSHDCAFSVQIGAYKVKDLTQYMDSHPNFGVEVGEDGLKRYTLGYFTSYWEAKSFSKYLDGHGGQTYVVGFYKGERVPDLKDMTQCTF